MHTQDVSQVMPFENTKKFHKLQLPQANEIALQENTASKVIYRPDTAEEILSSARIASDSMRFEKAFKDYNRAAQIYFDQERFSQSRAIIAKASAILQTTYSNPIYRICKKILLLFGVYML